MMTPLTGGEKYNTKQLIVKVNEIYPRIEEITKKANFENNNGDLAKLYDYTLEIFMGLTALTLNIINSSTVLRDEFGVLQEVHYYKDVNKSNKEALLKAVDGVPSLQEELINLVESDTSNRDAVLRQIMDELGIVDPNAKKKKSLW